MQAEPVPFTPVLCYVWHALHEASGRMYRSGLATRAPMGAIGALRSCSEAEKVPPDRENEVGLLVAEQLGKLLDVIRWDWSPMRSVIRGGELFFEDAPEELGGRDGDAATLIAEDASPRERNGRLLAADALCDLLDALGDSTQANKVRESSAQKWQAWSSSDKRELAKRALWSSWLPPEPEDGEAPARLHAYSAPTTTGEQRTFYAFPNASPMVHRAVAEAVILRWASTRTGFMPATVETASGARYAGMNKLGSSIAWAIGAPGDPSMIEFGGEHYAASPITRYVPRFDGITTKGLPAERTLAIEVAGERRNDLLAIAIESHHALTPLAGKVMTLFLTLSGRRAGSLGDLTRLVHPGRSIQSRELRTMAEALRLLMSLRVVFHDGVIARVFDIGDPGDTPSADQRIVVSLGASLIDAISRPSNSFLGGYALINIDGTMRLKTTASLQRRLYLLAAGDWNDATMRGGVHRPRPLKEWAGRANLHKRDASPQKVTDAATLVFDAARDLHNEGLVVLHEGKWRGRETEITIKPTAEHLEALRIRRDNGAR